MISELKNRKDQKIVVEIEGAKNTRGLVFVVHGLSGSKDQPHIKVMRESFLDAGFKVVACDMTNAFGDSDGDLVNATATSYIEDFEDIIDWAEEQEWYEEPFIIAGHSLGGLTAITFTHRNKDKVKAIFPMSTVVSGDLWKSAHDGPRLEEWKREGKKYKKSKSLPGKEGYIGWGLAEDLTNYDMLDLASSITCPVLLVVGSDDNGTTSEMHEMLLGKLEGQKEMHIIDGMGHNPRNDDHFGRMKDIIESWSKKL